MSYFPEHQKTVVIPVQWKEGKWEPFYGGEMPKIREGAMADLTLSADALINPEDLKHLSSEKAVEILSAGSLLWARMSRDHYRGHRRLGVPKGFRSQIGDRLEDVVLVPFILREPLNLLLRGTKLAQLCPCLCEAEDLAEDVELLSINQTYTRLSEKFEPGRRSHAGNVFTKVCFTDKDGYISPLDVLRKSEVVKWEKSLTAQADESCPEPPKTGESPN